MKRFFTSTFILFLLISSLPFSMYAQYNSQSADSQTCITKIGDPDPTLKPSPGPLGCTVGGGASSDLLKVGEDIKNAYNKYGKPPGSTIEYVGLADLLDKELQNDGYSGDRVDAFETRRGTAIVSDPNLVGGQPCIQCLGYVGIVGALWSGSSDCAKTLCLNNAGEVNDKYKTTGFQFGDYHFAPLAAGEKVQPGDIAVGGTAADAGHIAFVYSTVPGDDVHVYFLESNGYVDCRITDNREAAIDGYTFFRKQ